MVHFGVISANRTLIIKFKVCFISKRKVICPFSLFSVQMLLSALHKFRQSRLAFLGDRLDPFAASGIPDLTDQTEDLIGIDKCEYCKER